MDALKSCRHCGAQISADAQFCKTSSRLPVTAELTSAPHPHPLSSAPMPQLRCGVISNRYVL